jgi:Fe-S oxidoreductase
MSDKVVFWYGCNVVRHGDIIHSAIEILRAIGLEVAPVGGPSYCCGTTKDANLRAADGMAKRTVEKFNELAVRLSGDGDTGDVGNPAQVVTWCPSCHRHMGQFMGGYTEPQFPMAHFAQIVHAARDRLRERLVHPVERRVVLHRHFGFREVDVNPLVEDLLRLIPGLDLVTSEVSVPGHMCSALVSVPQALKDVTRGVCELAAAARADDVVTVYHSCQRLLCGLEASEPFRVVNYVTLLGESMGLSLVDEYKQWKTAGSEQAVLEKIGPGRVAALGEGFVREQLMPELLRAPAK